MNTSVNFKLFIGSMITIIPLLTLFSDAEIIDENLWSLYITQKLIFSTCGLVFIIGALLKKEIKYLIETVFTASLIYTVINSYFIAGYSLMYYQVLFACTVFFKINKKFYILNTIVITSLLIYTINISSDHYFQLSSAIDRYKFDSIVSLLIFFAVLLVGKYYLDKEKAVKKAAEQKINQQAKEIFIKNKQLENAMDDKTALLHVLLHDITTPVQLIMLNQKQLLSDDLKTRMDASTNIKKYTENIVGILKNIRKVEALKSGKISLALGPVVLKEAILDTIELFEEKLEKKNITVNFKQLINDNATIVCERHSFVYSVLGNILSNAIKFSKNDSTININTFEENDNYHIEVVDRGIGIPKKILDNLFSHHCETTRKGTNGESGTGFGMPLVKAFVTKYGGSIDMQSRCRKLYHENSGTRATIIIKKYNKELLINPKNTRLPQAHL
jgi:signal transduction histidine kinase